MQSNKRKFYHSAKYYRNVRKYAAQISTEPITATISQSPLETTILLENTNETITASSSLQEIQSSPSLINEIPKNLSDYDSYHSEELSSTSGSDNHESENKISDREKLRLWALEYQITHRAVNALLQLFPKIGIKDSRSLLQTPRSVNIVNISGGQYWHNGFQDIEKILLSYETKPTKVSLKFNMDGLPVCRSSKVELWPILCSITEYPSHQPIIIGIYCGMTKPKVLNEYLRQFVDDLKGLLQKGILIDAKTHVKVAIHCFICDTPARSFVKGKFLKCIKKNK